MGFDPFNDRMSRDIRNQLSRAFVQGLADSSLGPVQRVADRFLGLELAPFHRAYIRDRLARYAKVVEALRRAPCEDPLARMVVLWNHGLLFEVHELLEEVWRTASFPEKDLYQALIRAAGYYIKREQGRPEAARKMAAKALPVLSAMRDLLPFDPEPLLAALGGARNGPPRLQLRTQETETMANPQLPDWLRALLEPQHFPHPADDLKLLQTHISYVILAGDLVYKFKKPVNFGFLDFTTLEKRKYFCEQEVVLNRRLCPAIYLGTVAVTREGSDYRMDGPGEVVEYGVKMARLPEEGMMANLIRKGELDRSRIDAIVKVLVPFYRDADGSGEIPEFGRAERVAVNVLENFEQTERFIGSRPLSREQFQRISSYAREFLSHRDLFDQRIEEGRVRDCHGDLYSANICFAGDKVCIFDCIEFNQRFRYCDVASDVAFLAMDLDYHGLTDLSGYFIETFIQASGDATLTRMLNFYKCYRAYVRGKINLFTAFADEVDPDTRSRSLEMAERYFVLADMFASETP